MTTPELSVIMSVYNTKQEYLKASIESILNQTYRNFEFIIIDDCSTDGSLEIINKYSREDDRIIIIHNSCNKGLTKSLNIGLSIARGIYISRMDADDYSLPQRFQKQIEYLNKHKEVGAVGGYGFAGRNNGRALTHWVKNQKRLKASMMLRNSGIPHPTAMFRRVMQDGYVVQYDESIKKSQDYALWAEIIKHANIVLIPDFLILYRVHKNQISSQSSLQREYSRMVIVRQVKEYLKIDDDTAERISHLSDLNDQLPDDSANPLFEKILSANSVVKSFDEDSIKWIVNEMKCERYFVSKVSYNYPKVGIKAIFNFLRYYYITRLRYDIHYFFFYIKNRRLITDILKNNM